MIPDPDSLQDSAATDSILDFRQWWHSPKTWKCGTLNYTRPKLAILFFWLLWGDVCYVLMESVTPGIMPLKLHDLGAPNWLLGMMMTTLSGGITFFLNPVISFKSDRFRSRWGRRIPFIVGSAPLLVACLVLIAFGDRVGYWAHDHLGFLARYSPNTVAVAVLGFALAMFTFFNTFVTAVFWYLFNDVVPEHLLARFMSWFRVVSTATSAFYGFFIFGHARTHFTEIFVGAALLYFVGFLLMCLNVKEGEYPPPPANIDHKVGRIAEMKTYGKECFSLSHYRYQYIITFCGSVSAGIGMFGVFMSLGLGMTLEQSGRINATMNVTVAVMILISGWLADRYHPIRVVMAGVFFQFIVATPLTFIWFFWHTTPANVYHYSLVIAVVLSAPIAAMNGVWDPPLFMRYFPRDRYGQFCSANAMCRAAGGIVGGALAGIYLDVVGKYFTPADIAHRAGGVAVGGVASVLDPDLLSRFSGHYNQYYYIPFWHLAFSIPGVFLIVKMYRSWKKYGGDASYIPPLPAGDAKDAMSGPKWESETPA